jgi:hypothetical protein
MRPKLINDLREVMQDSAGQPVEIQDTQTHQVYVVMTRQAFQRLIYDDSDLSPEEMQAAAAPALADPEGWDARGMKDYDRLDSDSSPS